MDDEITMFYFKIIAALLLFICGSFLVVMNWAIIFTCLLRKKHSSWVPLAGGIMLAYAIIFQPFWQIQSYAWIPLVIDWGCIPGFTYAFVYLICIYFQKIFKKRIDT